MILKQKSPIGFAELAMQHAETHWRRHWLKKVLELIDWSPFEKKFQELYSDRGRPAWDPVLLFRSFLLADWNGLSDRQLEEAIIFRYDYRKFIGLPLEQSAPDATTFVVFRDRIQDIWKELLRMLNRQIENAGFSIQKAVAADATLVEAQSKPKKNPDDGKPQGGDPDGSWRGFPPKTIKTEDGKEQIARRSALFGFKVNLSASVGTGFVNKVKVTTAKDHEGPILRDLLGSRTKVVYADKGYSGLKNRNLLERLEIRDGIQRKGRRGHPLGKRDTERNKRITKSRRIVEGVFGSWKMFKGWVRTRFRGLIRNGLAAGISALAWNMKKFALLTG